MNSILLNLELNINIGKMNISFYTNMHSWGLLSVYSST